LTAGYKGSRAIANRGTALLSPAEKNVSKGNLLEPVARRQFRVIGLDIGKTSFSKIGVGEQFGRRIRNAYLDAPGSEIIIRGNMSPSVRTSPADADLATRRAESAKALLVKEGIPANLIRIEGTPKSNVDPRAISPEQKASMRGASVEIVPPKTINRPEKGFTDQLVFLESKERLGIGPRFPLDPWLGKLIWPKTTRPSDKNQDDRSGHVIDQDDKIDHVIKFLYREGSKGAGLVSIALAAAAGVNSLGGTARDLAELEKLADEVFKQRTQDRGKRNDNKERRQFIRLVEKRIGMDETHPLKKLIDPKTGRLRGPRILYSFELPVDAGDVINAHSGVPPHYALELTLDNRGLMRGERLGVIFFKPAKLIGGVPVMLNTAVYLEKKGIIPAGSVEESPLTLGWDPRGGLIFK
jgi:hypothetical protein